MFTFVFMNKVYFVYSLSYNGIPFYIGSTCNVITRYSNHAAGNNNNTRDIVLLNLKKCVIPSIKIIFHSSNRKDVLNKEYEIITRLRKRKVPLCNNSLNDNKNRIFISQVTQKDTRAFIRTSEVRSVYLKYQKKHSLI